MKPNFYTLVVLVIVLPFSIVNAQPSTPSLTSDWYNQALKSIQQIEDQIKPAAADGYYNATNAHNRTGFYISATGYKVTSLQQSGWQVSFQLKGIGRSELQWTPDETCAVTHNVNQLTYNYNNIAVQYINNSDGLRQNFLVNGKMPGSGALTVTIEPVTDLQPRLLTSSSLAFFNADDKMLLAYEDLHVWDANHNNLPAAMHFKNGLLTIEVDDSHAAYPVTIDPLTKTPEWSTSADGLFSGLTTLQINSALYGYAVTGLGDVNGDGYGDAAISAPALTNILSGNGSLAGVGAVFVFYGSPAGLSTTPAKTLQPNTAVAGALFGLSVDAGDVNGDGINDIIVGAPLDSYSTTVDGLIPTTMTVKAGKVYVFPGGNNAATNPTNFLEIKLQGTDFFSKGIANILGSNVSVNALFGFSVAATGDLDGDNKSDIVVGAPAYLGIGLGAIQNGAAFVYYSGNLATTSPVQLQPPSASLLGLVSLPVNTSGLLFGFSVDGAGDYNNDGKNDVIVGAPAGIDLSSLGGLLNGQVLGGTAHMYYGTGSGVSNTIGTTLKSSTGSLLGNAANLFGYKVRGLKGLNGVRNGSIAVGAPLGGLLPNTLSLTIKSGNVHLFKQTTSPGASATSNQVLESPRSGSLLSILNTLHLNVLFGAAIDNAYDVNCDGYTDLVVGEPLSSGATLLQLQANAVGGAAYVFLGSSGGAYNPIPPYTASVNYGSDILSVNAVSLFGYSVAGIPDSRGVGTQPRILVGAPAAALDFDNSLLNLGSTLGLLFNFAAGDNGPGKGYLFNTQLCGATALPITLMEFKGQQQNTTINLSWKTSHEENFNRFEVEKSRDGVTFQSIGLVFPWENANHIDYVFSDKNAAPGNNYYRLKMIDNDASYKYSNMLTFSVEQMAGAKIVVAPNPVVNKISVQLTGLSENAYRMEISNVMGQKFIEKTINITRYSQTEYLTRTASMTPGIYFLTIFDKNFRKIASNRVLIF